MTIAEYQNRKTPEYTDTMYLDKYSPQAILAAAHQKMFERYTGTEPEETVNFVCEVNVN